MLSGARGAHSSIFDYYDNVDTNVFKYVILVALGAVAQLGERLNGIQKVVGSIPISSTKYFQAVALLCLYESAGS
jgi:hypothetical protein